MSLCTNKNAICTHMIFKRDKFQNIAGAFQTTITRRNTSRDCLNKHFHLIFITTDKTSLHCLQVALKVCAKLAKVLKAAFSSEAGHQLSSVCCLRSLATSTQQLVQEKREKGRSTGEKIGKAGYGHGHGQRNRIFHTPDGAPVLSAIVLYLAPLCSPLLTRLLSI